ncbi:Timeless protein [Melia azedarach]|uniref:Timeless protein n=2 Tax=Melia azedarach TaxID=155640 RepID=A0ACC1X5I7_MELAZ|nr:Timeless protein [Melia azedarach]KAJ4705909.1 Timeless protein [Melia azedarach]
MEMESLSVICAGLGLVEEDERGNRIGYSKGEQCLENIKDLLRFLRRDDPQKREVFKQVCKWNIVSKDLVPIIEHCQDDRNLVLNAVKVLVFLSMPIEPSSNDIPQQIEYLWGLKSAIACSDTVAVVVSLLEGPLENLESEAFAEDDWKLVQLVMTLFRNILAVQDIPLQQKAGGSASQFLSLRDRFLELLFNENVMDIIIVITQHIGGCCGYFRQDNLLLLETFHYIFMGQDPELIAKARQKGSKMGGDTKDSLDSLKSIIAEEQEKRRLSRLHNLVRHSQFSGTFARLTMDGSKAVFKGNPASASQNPILKPHKGVKGANKKIVWDQGSLPSTKDNVLELLHDFVDQFLSGSYNVLMQSIREDIEKEHPAIQSSDIIMFFRVAQFVTSFQYHKIVSSKPVLETEKVEASTDEFAGSTLFNGNICGPISSSMDESMFRLVISKWQNAFDGLKETNNYKFLSAAGSLMKNMIRMLDLVLKSLPENSKEPQTARILLYKLFYDQTDQGMTQFLLNLVKVFDTRKQPKSDLADLVEMIYVLLRLMENLQARGALRVSKRSRKARKKGTLKGNKETESELSGNHATVQNETCMSNSGPIENSWMLHKESLADATSDGKEHMDIPVKVDEPGTEVQEMRNHGVNLLQKDNRKSDHADDYLQCSTSDSSGDEQPAATNEVDFRVSMFLSSFANTSIIQKLCWLLKFYKSNSNRTNHYIICILQRITDDLELSPMLYQLSLLPIFYDILAEQKSCPSKNYANIVDFLTRLVQKMLKKMKNQPLLFVEILFWKTRRECHYINAEYLLHELGHAKKISGTWEDVSEVGDIGSSKAKGWACRSIADALGEDEADVMISHDLGYQKNEGTFEVQEGVTSISNSEIDGKENSDHGITSMQEESINVSKRKRRLVLSDEWDLKIKDLYERFKDEWSCSRLIAESLDPDGKVSAAQVSNKLRQLGLQVAPKKRVRYSGEPSTVGLDQHGEDRCKIETNNALHNSNDLEGSSLRHPLNKSKRVHAFNSDQEAMIKALFEQFKDHKRCSHMIANALDAGNKFTAAQISRKLKQLGLCAPQQKWSKANMHLRDEELNNSSKDEAHDSDNETLLSFRNRRKSKDGGRLFIEESQVQNTLGKLSDDSDDETLGAVLKKSRKLPVKPKHDMLQTIWVEESNENMGHGTTNSIMERDGCNQSGGMEVAENGEGISIDRVSLEGASKTEVIDTQPPDVSPVNNEDDLPQELLDDDLADSGDDVTTDELLRSSVNRRKLRMVIDPEDGD